MTSICPPALRLAGHPHSPERLGYMRALRMFSPDVARLQRTTKPYTLMSARTLTTLYREGVRTPHAGVEGDFVEIGVHRRGSAAVLAALIRQEQIRHPHLGDRWGDSPEPTRRDGNRYEEYRKDRIADKLADLRDYCRRLWRLARGAGGDRRMAGEDSACRAHLPATDRSGRTSAERLAPAWA